MWSYMNCNMSYMPRRWNTCCMPRPYMNYYSPMCGNSIFYPMAMFSLGYMTGNTIMSLFGLGQNYSYQQPTLYTTTPAYTYPQYSSLTAPAYTYPQFGSLTTPAYTYPQYSSLTAPAYTYPQFGSLTTPVITQTGVRTTSTSSQNTSRKVSAKTKTQKTKKSNIQVSTTNNLPRLNEIGYNSNKGIALAKDAAEHAKKRSVGLCAKYVKKAIKRTGLGKYESGHAYQCADILSRNPNFKEVKITESEFKNLPAGCIVIYPKGESGYSKKYGHIEITLGDGNAVSDFVNNNTKYSENMRVFVPVTTQ